MELYCRVVLRYLFTFGKLIFLLVLVWSVYNWLGKRVRPLSPLRHCRPSLLYISFTEPEKNDVPSPQKYLVFVSCFSGTRVKRKHFTFWASRRAERGLILHVNLHPEAKIRQFRGYVWTFKFSEFMLLFWNVANGLLKGGGSGLSRLRWECLLPIIA